MKNKVLWYIKQLLPLTYYSKYKQNGETMFCIWKMCFGKTFSKVSFKIK